MLKPCGGGTRVAPRGRGRSASLGEGGPPRLVPLSASGVGTRVSNTDRKPTKKAGRETYLQDRIIPEKNLGI